VLVCNVVQRKRSESRGDSRGRSATPKPIRDERSRSKTPAQTGLKDEKACAPNRRSASTAPRAALIAAAHERPEWHVSLCTSAALCEPHCSSVTGRRRSRRRRSSGTNSFSGTSLRASERRIGTSRARCRSTYFRASEARGRQIVVEIERRTRVCVSFWQCTRISHSAGMGIGGSLASGQGRQPPPMGWRKRRVPRPVAWRRASHGRAGQVRSGFSLGRSPGPRGCEQTRKAPQDGRAAGPGPLAAVLVQGYQGASGSIRNQDQGWGYQGSLISGSRVNQGVASGQPRAVTVPGLLLKARILVRLFFLISWGF